MGGTTPNIARFPRRLGYISEDAEPTAAGYMVSLFSSVNRRKLGEAKAFIDAGIPLQPFIPYESGGMRHPRGWAVGTGLSGAKEFLGGDYDYAKARIWGFHYFGLPLGSTLRLAPLYGWIRGISPVQSRFSTLRSAGLNPRRGTGFRNVAGDGTRGERLLAASAEISRPLLSRTPLHSVIPLTGYLFYDIAYTWPARLETRSIGFEDFNRSWGCGIHLEFLAFEVAFPADGRDYDRSEFYFSINWGDW